MDWYQPFDFTGRNETDVREAIVRPMLHAFGYQIGTANDIITEQPLRDPRISIGHRKPGDPILSGIADYILDIDGRWRWVVEVKGPAEQIDDKARDQAWSYASHPEVKGIYYLITNGRRFELYRSSFGPKAPPVLSFLHEEASAQSTPLMNFVAPDSFKRDFPNLVIDFGAPLAPGLRSFAKVLNGKVTYTTFNPPKPAMVGFISHLREGSVERTGKQIVASIIMESSNLATNEIIKTLGLEKFAIATNDESLSLDPNKPTVFSAPLDWEFPAGTQFPNPTGGNPIALPVPLKFKSITTASGYISGTLFSGSIEIDYKADFIGAFRASGVFEMHLS